LFFRILKTGRPRREALQIRVCGLSSCEPSHPGRTATTSWRPQRDEVATPRPEVPVRLAQVFAPVLSTAAPQQLELNHLPAKCPSYAWPSTSKRRRSRSQFLSDW